MIKIENVEIVGWESAIRGMRNPMNSWDKSDTKTVHIPETPRVDYSGNVVEMIPEHDAVVVTRCEEQWNGVGNNDLDLMNKLAKAGTDHRKFMRMIVVYVDVTAPLYWWKEFDTYKVGTVRNSCSTMHKITEKEFTLDDFSHEHLIPEAVSFLSDIIDCLNDARKAYIHYDEEKDKLAVDIDKKGLWWNIIQLLPSSYNQRATLMLNYEVLANMYHSRKNHKLDDWVEFCKWIETLPYSELIIGDKQ